jgi:hypothetical protein
VWFPQALFLGNIACGGSQGIVVLAPRYSEVLSPTLVPGQINRKVHKEEDIACCVAIEAHGNTVAIGKWESSQGSVDVEGD